MDYLAAFFGLVDLVSCNRSSVQHNIASGNIKTLGSLTDVLI